MADQIEQSKLVGFAALQAPSGVWQSGLVAYAVLSPIVVETGTMMPTIF
jgi:hypothetical protein